MSLRAFVVEDEPAARDYLCELLHDTGDISISGATGDLDSARSWLQTSGGDVDVVFVDLVLTGSTGSGFDLLRHANGSEGPRPEFVVASALKQHALEAYELGVADYLVKPFSSKRVSEVVGRLTKRLVPRTSVTPSRIIGRDRSRLVLLPLEQVLAFESESRLTFVHADDGRYDIDLSLAVLEKLLPNDVLRVARNWLVNPRHVRAIDRHDGQLVLEVGGKGLRVPVARERNQRLRELLLRDGLGLRQR